MSILDDCLAAITPVDEQARAAAEARQLSLTKPPGALGELEVIGNQLAAIAGQCPPPVPEPAKVFVFAGDHGVQGHWVSPWPQEVTLQMAANIAGGGAGVNVLARCVGVEVEVVDVGMLQHVEQTTDRRIAAGTADMVQGPAMAREQAVAAIEVGIDCARQAVAEGHRALIPGEVGIGNTTVAATLVCAFTGASAEQVTGRGAGANDEVFARKQALVAQAVQHHGLADGSGPKDPIGALAAVGGFEHAAMVGLILGAAEARVPLLLDGAIACSAALVALALAPDAKGYLLGGHEGAEPSIRHVLDAIELRPVVQLGLRLGEGTGAVLAQPIVVSAAKVLREMATFGDAGVTEEHL